MVNFVSSFCLFVHWFDVNLKLIVLDIHATFYLMSFYLVFLAALQYFSAGPAEENPGLPATLALMRVS